MSGRISPQIAQTAMATAAAVVVPQSVAGEGKVCSVYHSSCSDVVVTTIAKLVKDMQSGDMRNYVSKTPPAGSEDGQLAARALAEWPEWTCEAYPGFPGGRFQESRWWEVPGRERVVEERCLVTSGHASLWLEGGEGELIEIGLSAGEWVTFRKDFQCIWVIHERMAKRYAYFDAEGREI